MRSPTDISDDSLRVALAEFSSDLGTRYAEQYSNELYFSFIREYAGRMGFPWYDPITEDSGSESLQPTDWEHMKLLRDRRFQEQLAMRTDGPIRRIPYRSGFVWKTAWSSVAENFTLARRCTP